MIDGPLVLVVEDDPNIADLVDLYLRKNDFRTIRAVDGATGLAAVRNRRPDLVLLDIGLPGDLDGFDVCQRLRASSKVPVIFMTARDDEVDRVMGLKLGADDYVSKPFSPRELVARVEAVLRRTSADKPDGPRRHEIGNLVVDEMAHEASVDGQSVELTRREYDLLLALVEHRGLTLSRRQLLDLAWGTDWVGDERTVDVHVRQLRAKFDHHLDLRTVRGTGYRMA
ncbi:MAG: response regulator transcription factor [Acidimicrobiales bacterium]|nr:response regulator transcription factor [Acidimicrobiales bacterium]